MVPRTAATGAPHPDAVEFVRFCHQRRRVGWPELYDEMCAVAGRGLFRGYSADDLGGIGVGFSLFDMPALACLTSRIVAEEKALRKPVSVVISGVASVASTEDSRITTAIPTPAGSGPIPGSASPAVTTPAVSGSTPPPGRAAATASSERSFDVPIRLALAPSGA